MIRRPASEAGWEGASVSAAVSDLDEALERFQAGALEYAGGLANHGPMAAEALLRLGHPAKLPGLVQLYAPRLGAREIGTPLKASERPQALGRPERIPDWVATFERDLDETSWTEFLRESCDALCDGLFAAATHGLLRVAHAVRALEEAETAPRRRELAFGLAYWAGRYQKLPGTPGTREPEGADRGPAAVLQSIETLPLADRRAGFLFDAVGALDGRREFALAIDRASIESPSARSANDDGFHRFINELCRSAAALYLANPQSRIAYVHTLTAPSALRLIAPYLSDATRARAAGRALQAAAALHAISAGSGEPSAPGPDDEVLRAAEDPAEIRYHAACSLQEHAIKFSEACLREYALAPDPLFRVAAADAALRIEGGSAARC
jgi:hypothetical protein